MKKFLSIMVVILLLQGCISKPVTDQNVTQSPDTDSKTTTRWITDEMVDYIDVLVEQAGVMVPSAELWNGFVVERTNENELQIDLTSSEPDMKFYFIGKELVSEVKYKYEDTIRYFDQVYQEAALSFIIDRNQQNQVGFLMRTPQFAGFYHYHTETKQLVDKDTGKQVTFQSDLQKKLTETIQSLLTRNVASMDHLATQIEEYLIQHAIEVEKKTIERRYYRSERDHWVEPIRDNTNFRIGFSHLGMYTYDGQINSFEEYVVQSLLFASILDQEFEHPEEIRLTSDILRSYLMMSPAYGCTNMDGKYQCYRELDRSEMAVPDGLIPKREGYFSVVKLQDYLQTIKQSLGREVVVDYASIQNNLVTYDNQYPYIVVENQPSEIPSSDHPYFIVDTISQEGDVIRFVGYRYRLTGMESRFLEDSNGNLYYHTYDETYDIIKENSRNFEQWEFLLEDNGARIYSVLQGKIINK